MKPTSGRTYQVDFYMRLDDRGWRIVDVLVEGVSYVRSYRGDFGLEIRASSLDALNKRLEDSPRGRRHLRRRVRPNATPVTVPLQ